MLLHSNQLKPSGFNYSHSNLLLLKEFFLCSIKFNSNRRPCEDLYKSSFKVNNFISLYINTYFILHYIKSALALRHFTASSKYNSYTNIVHCLLYFPQYQYPPYLMNTGILLFLSKKKNFCCTIPYKLK